MLRPKGDRDAKWRRRRRGRQKQKQDRTGGERNACAGERAYKSEFCTGMSATQQNGQRTRITGCLSETI